MSPLSSRAPVTRGHLMVAKSFQVYLPNVFPVCPFQCNTKIPTSLRCSHTWNAEAASHQSPVSPLLPSTLSSGQCGPVWPHHLPAANLQGLLFPTKYSSNSEHSIQGPSSCLAQDCFQVPVIADSRLRGRGTAGKMRVNRVTLDLGVLGPCEKSCSPAAHVTDADSEPQRGALTQRVSAGAGKRPGSL